MVTQIQLGNFFSSGGKTVLGGVGGSGLDTEGLIKTLTDAKGLPATQLQDKIKVNDSKTAALREFQTLLSKFKDASNFLRNPPGVGNEAENVFKFTTTAVNSNTSVPGSIYVNVTASPGAALQTYTISDITSLAAAKQQKTGDISVATADTAAVSATPTGGQFQAGEFTLRGQTIELEAGDTLNEVASKFNAVSDTTGIAATVVKVADGTFKMLFSSTQTGTDNDFDLEDIADVTDDGDGVIASMNISLGQEADDAEFDFNGIHIIRSSNSINDIVSGVTFNLLQPTPDDMDDNTQIAVTVKPDAQIVQNGIVNFVNAYNDLKIFAAKQTQVGSDGKFVEDAVLSDNGTFRSTMNAINSQMASVVSGISGSNPNRLADLGITFTDLPESKDNPLVRNIINVDDGKLASAISTNIEGVRKVFEFDLITSNPNLQVFSRTNALGVSNFTLHIDPDNDLYQATYNDGSGPVTIDLDATAIPGDATGYTLKGKDGTVLEGLTLIYSSTVEATITVTTTQGIADKVFNTTDNAVKDDVGTLALELSSLQSSDDKLNTEIDRINEQVERFRQSLLEKFGALEAALSKVNTLLQSLDAQDKARTSGS